MPLRFADHGTHAVLWGPSALPVLQVNGRSEITDDLSRTYTWTMARSDREGVVKLGLQRRNEDNRSMHFERIFMTCNGTKRLAVSAWPAAPDRRPMRRMRLLTITADEKQHFSRDQKISFNEVDEVWAIDATISGFKPIQDMIGARNTRLDAHGIALILPRANAAVADFLSRCEKNDH